MQSNLFQRLANMRDANDKDALRPVLAALVDRLSSQATSTAGLVIKAGGGVLAKTGSAAFQGVGAFDPTLLVTS